MRTLKTDSLAHAGAAMRRGVGRHAGRRLGALVLMVTFAGGAISCSSHCGRDDDGARFEICAQRVRAGLDELRTYLPEEFQVQPGEIARQPTFSLTSEGIFSVTQSIEREVPSLGIGVTTLTIPVAKEEGLEVTSGVLVNRVESPAREVGINTGDIVLAVAGTEVVTPDAFETVLSGLGTDAAVEVSLFRDGEPFAARIQPASTTYVVRSNTWEVGFGTYEDFGRTGLKLVHLPDAVRPAVLGATTGARRGLVVGEVLVGGPAFFADLRAGDLIVAIDGEPVEDVAAYKERMEEFRPGSRPMFTVLRGGDPFDARVEVTRKARTDGGFEIPFVASYRTKPDHTRFGLIMGFLANYASCRSIPESRENRIETRWGVVCNLFNYEGTPEKTKVRFLWFIPIWFGR